MFENLLIVEVGRNAQGMWGQTCRQMGGGDMQACGIDFAISVVGVNLKSVSVLLSVVGANFGTNLLQGDRQIYSS